MRTKLKEIRSWFKWDYLSRNDEKISKLLRLEKHEGYGLFVCIIESLHENDGKIDFDSLVYSTRCKNKNKLKRILNDYELFYQDDDNLYKNIRVDEQLLERKQASKDGTTAANIRWEKEKNKKNENENL